MKLCLGTKMKVWTCPKCGKKNKGNKVFCKDENCSGLNPNYKEMTKCWPISINILVRK